MLRRCTLLFAFLAAAFHAHAQDRALMAPYPDSLCANCAAWNAPQAPFRLFGNSYYVGPRGLGVILVTSPEGHVVIDGALPNTVPQILASIRALGFDPADVKLLLLSHAHFDHAGGLAALQQATGARVAASPRAASVLEAGRSGADDPQYGWLLDFPPVAHVERFTPGDTLRVGPLALVSYATAGHTPGGTSWAWQACEGDVCRTVVYADSQTPLAADGFRYTDSATYPTALADFEQGHRTLETMACDLLVTTHPSASQLWERVEAGTLLDDQACKRYAAQSREQLARQLRQEAGAEQD